MKKIYAFSFDEEDCLCEKWRNNIRLIAYLLYDSIYNFYDETYIPLNINKNIVFNRIHEVEYNVFYLDSDYYDDGYVNYEPFLINRNCFALTVDDERITDKKVKQLLDLVLNMLNIKTKVNIYSGTYTSKNKDDEKNRNKAISLICLKNGLKFDKKTSLVKRLTRSNELKKNMNCLGRY